MNTNIQLHINWAKENCHVALDGFPATRVVNRKSSQVHIDKIVYEFDGRCLLEALQVESSSLAAACKQARSGAACFSAVGLLELQKYQTVCLRSVTCLIFSALRI